MALGFRATGFSTDFTPITTAGGLWRQKAQDVTFAAIGNVTYALGGGEDYSAGVPEIGQQRWNGRQHLEILLVDTINFLENKMKLQLTI